VGDDQVEKPPSAYTGGGPYTYLEAAARLLVRKDEVIAATEFISLSYKSEFDLEVTFVPQPQASGNSDNQVVGMFTFCCVLLLRRTISPR
jgi:hypothetical protein